MTETAPAGVRYSPAELSTALGLFPPTEEQAAVIAAPPGPVVVIAGAGVYGYELAIRAADRLAPQGT